jgi:hypothetical protein
MIFPFPDWNDLTSNKNKINKIVNNKYKKKKKKKKKMNLLK